MSEKLNSLSTPPKFIRRQDLTIEIRSALAIGAYQAQLGNVWGAITQFSQQYHVSKTFIYSLLFHFKNITSLRGAWLA